MIAPRACVLLLGFSIATASGAAFAQPNYDTGFRRPPPPALQPATIQPQSNWVGIPTERMNFFASPQRSQNWCWAASIQMIMNYYGIAVTQEEIVARTFGPDANGHLPDAAGGLEAITANLNNWFKDRRGARYAVTALVKFGAVDPVDLLNELKNGHPILLGYNPNLGHGDGGHAVVITAAHFNADGLPDRMTVRDPWPGGYLGTGGKKEFSSIDLALLTGSTQAYWMIRVVR